MPTDAALVCLAALALESRLAVVRLLVQAGPSGMAATKIANALSIGPTALSLHMKGLTNAHMVSPIRQGRPIIDSADFETTNGVLGFD